MVGANADTVFARFAKATGHPGWAEDERYTTHNARGENQEELDGMISGWTREHTVDEVLEALREAGVPASKVFTARDMLEDPHYAARENVVTVEDPEMGPSPCRTSSRALSRRPGRFGGRVRPLVSTTKRCTGRSWGWTRKSEKPCAREV